MSPVGTMCGVTLEAIASASAYAALATFLPRLEVLVYHLGRNRLFCDAYKILNGASCFVGVESDLMAKYFFPFVGTEARAMIIIPTNKNMQGMSLVEPCD